MAAESVLSSTTVATATAAAAAVTAWEVEAAANYTNPNFSQQLPAAAATTRLQESRPAASDPHPSDIWAQQPGSHGNPHSQQLGNDIPDSRPLHAQGASTTHGRSLLGMQQAADADPGIHGVRSQAVHQEVAESKGGHGRSLLRRHKATAARHSASQGSSFWQAGKKRASRRLDATGMDVTGGLGRGVQQSMQDLVGKQRQPPTQNQTEFQKEQLLLKAHFRLDVGEGPAKAKALGPRTIPRGLQPAQGFFDGATHQVPASFFKRSLAAHARAFLIVPDHGPAMWSPGISCSKYKVADQALSRP